MDGCSELAIVVKHENVGAARHLGAPRANGDGYEVLRVRKVFLWFCAENRRLTGLRGSLGPFGFVHPGFGRIIQTFYLPVSLISVGRMDRADHLMKDEFEFCMACGRDCCRETIS